MDSRAIETRLRLPAPDEPAVLPPLFLPAIEVGATVSPRIRLRGPVVAPVASSLPYAIVALVLLMLAVIVAGALRIIDRPSDGPGLACTGPAWADEDCFTMAWPDGWHQLAAGDRSQGDFTEPGIAYERVRLILASVPIAGCAASTDPAPTPFESDGFVVIPRETAGADLACLRTAPLPDGSVRITAMVGERSAGLAAPGGPAIPDTSEPTADAGWTEQVDGRPARLAVEMDLTGDGTPTEIRTLDVLLPNSIHRVLRIRAEIVGPDLAAGRAHVDAILASVRFATAVRPIDPGDEALILRMTVDAQDRGARAGRSDFYGCFPREAGSRAGTITSGPTIVLPAPVDVTCQASIEASAAGLWRVQLRMEWPAGAGYAAGGLMEELFVGGAGSISVGYLRQLDGTPMPPVGEEVWLPMAPRGFAPPLSGPLNLPIGSLVTVLYPGSSPQDEPRPGSDAQDPSLVGRFLLVTDGPRVVDGDEWYEVLWYEGEADWNAATRWIRGTMNGYPLLALGTPTCPSSPVAFDRLMLLTPPELLVCFGSTEITLRPVFSTVGEPREPLLCAGPTDPEPTTCPPLAGVPAWLTGYPDLRLFGPDGPDGPIPGLEAWLDPAVGDVPIGAWLAVRGHFDDAAAATCRWIDDGAFDIVPLRADLQGHVCRGRFVITGFERVTPP